MKQNETDVEPPEAESPFDPFLEDLGGLVSEPVYNPVDSFALFSMKCTGFCRKRGRGT